MPTLTDAHAGLVIIRDAFQEVLNADTENFPNGADAFLAEDEPGDPERAGKPYVVFSEEADDWGDAWGMREVQATAICKANDFNGGRTGAANPVAAHTLLSDKLATFCRDAYSDLSAQGVHGIDRTGPRNQPVVTEDESVVQTATHRVIFRYEDR